jgi:hypothetical protein
MYYHAWLRLEGGSQTWANLRRDSVISDVIVPFINRQVAPVQYGERRDIVAVLNFGSAAYLSVVRSAEPLKDPSAHAVYTATVGGTCENCTRELLDEAVLTRAEDGARSLIEYALKPPQHRVFVVMQLGVPALESAYRQVIKRVIKESHFHCLRIDEIQDAKPITTQILEAIASSEVVLCDLSGARPNCYYEAGFASALGRTLILTIRAPEMPEFDLSVNRFIIWKSKRDLETRLRERLLAITSRPGARVEFSPS